MNYNDGDLQKLISLGMNECDDKQLSEEQKEALRKERAEILERLRKELIPQAFSPHYLEIIKGYTREMNGQEPEETLRDLTDSMMITRLSREVGARIAAEADKVQEKAPDIYSLLKRLKVEVPDFYSTFKKRYVAALAQHLGRLIAHRAPLEEKNLPAIIWREATRGRSKIRLETPSGWVDTLPSPCGMGALSFYAPGALREEEMYGFVLQITVDLVKALEEMNIHLLTYPMRGQYLFVLTQKTLATLKIESSDQTLNIPLQVYPSQQQARTALQEIILHAKENGPLSDMRVAKEAARMLKAPPRGPGDNQPPDTDDPARAE